MIHPTFICVLLFVIHRAEAVPVNSSKIPPVDLAYECVQKTGKTDSKTPILLLHGMTATMRLWDGIYETLAFKTGRRVCRADLRNHGDSPWDDEASIAAMTEDVIHLLDTLEEQTIVLIGHSIGGKVAIHTAVNYPARIESLVVEDMVPNIEGVDVQAFINSTKSKLAVMEEVPEGSDEEQATEFLIYFYREEFKQRNMTEDEMKQEIFSSLTCPGGKCRWKTNFNAFVKAAEKDYDHFATVTSGVFDAPALFIYGTASEVKVFEHENEIRKMFPKVKLVGVEGAGHVIHGAFRQFEDEVLKFLEETNVAL